VLRNRYNDNFAFQDNSSDENIRMAVFMGLFFVVIVICVACVVKVRCSFERLRDAACAISVAYV